MTTQDAAPPAGFMAQVGRRNLAYAGFVALLVGLTLVLEAAGPCGPDSGGGIMFGVILWAIVSVPLFLWNLGALIAALSKDRPAGKALIGVLLPVLCVLLPMTIPPPY